MVNESMHLLKQFIFVLILLFPGEAWLNRTYLKSMSLESAVKQGNIIVVVKELKAEVKDELRIKKFQILRSLKGSLKKSDKISVYDPQDLQEAHIKKLYSEGISKSPMYDRMDSSLIPDNRSKTFILFISTFISERKAYASLFGPGLVKVKFEKEVIQLLKDNPGEAIIPSIEDHAERPK